MKKALNNKVSLSNLTALFLMLFIAGSSGCSLLQSRGNSNASANNNASVGNNDTARKEATSGDKAQNTTTDLCRNEYYPVGPNVERKYRIEYPKNMFPTSEYTERYTDFKDDVFVAITDIGEVSTRVNWRCTADGLFATQYNNSVDMKSAGSSEIDTLEASGVSFLSESRWNTGEKWSADYKVKQTMKSPEGKVTGGGAGIINQSGEVLGAEEVTVPAGTFQTMKVKVKTDLDMTITVAGVTVPAKMSLETLAWFAKGKGMVKSTTGIGKQGVVTTELLTFKDK
jgi:hypothetical protein